MLMAKTRRSWTPRLFDTMPSDASAILIIGLVVGLGTLQAVPRPDSARAMGVWAATALFLTLFAVGRRLALAAPLLAAGLLAALLQVLSPSGPAIVAAYATVIGAALRLPPRPAGLIAGANIVAFLVD